MVHCTLCWDVMLGYIPELMAILPHVMLHCQSQCHALNNLSKKLEVWLCIWFCMACFVKACCSISVQQKHTLARGCQASACGLLCWLVPFRFFIFSTFLQYKFLRLPFALSDNCTGKHTLEGKQPKRIKVQLMCSVHMMVALHCCCNVQAVGVPTGVATLATAANEMIILSGCATLQPLIRDLYPAKFSSAESLQLTPAGLQSIPAMDPQLAACAESLG